MPKRVPAHIRAAIKRDGAKWQWPEPKPGLSGWCMKNLPPGQHEQCRLPLCTCDCHKQGTMQDTTQQGRE